MEEMTRILLIDFVKAKEINPNESFSKNYSPFNHCSDRAGDFHLSDYPQLIELSTKSASVLLALLNFIFHALSIIVFVRWDKRPIITLLMTLSISEAAFNLGYFSAYIILYFSNCKSFLIPSVSRTMAIILYSIVLPLEVLLIHGCILMRNWTVTMIALARFEAIRYPLKPKKMCEGRSLRVILFLIALICLSFGSIRIFDKTFIVSSTTNKIIQFKPLLMQDGRLKYLSLNILFLIMRGASPVISTFLYFALLYQLHSASQTVARRSSNNQLQSGKIEEFANRVAIFVWIVFFIFETPQCVVYLLYHILRVMTSREIVRIAEITFFLDSTANFCIYGLLNKQFRTDLIALFKCSPRTMPRMMHPNHSNISRSPALPHNNSYSPALIHTNNSSPAFFHTDQSSQKRLICERPSFVKFSKHDNDVAII